MGFFYERLFGPVDFFGPNPRGLGPNHVRRTKLTGLGLMSTLVLLIVVSIDKYDVEKHRDSNVYGDDAFTRLYASVDADIEELLQKVETTSKEKGKASAVAINAEICRTNARLLVAVKGIEADLAVKANEDFASKRQQFSLLCYWGDFIVLCVLAQVKTDKDLVDTLVQHVENADRLFQEIQDLQKQVEDLEDKLDFRGRGLRTGA
ncbi:hypothetical protein LR48_Vigan10g129300 [Vigna angularis]|uniref:Uncharacterized protein n=1 Tax=Phaseolus angularis TaxID=3914 RepID=A0A0L9VK25_PHAAN|nr:hypothetical protein LR48_Vigan10g129300 [Vigna angularis]